MGDFDIFLSFSHYLNFKCGLFSRCDFVLALFFVQKPKHNKGKASIDFKENICEGMNLNFFISKMNMHNPGIEMVDLAAK